MKTYLLKNKDEAVLSFNAGREKSCDELFISDIKTINEKSLPFQIDTNALESSLTKWLKSRRLPEYRVYADMILATLDKQGFKDDFMDYIDYGLGLSLNDSLWIVPQSENLKWADFSLYTHHFNANLQSAARGAKALQIAPFVKSPELTTNGMLPKFWLKTQDKILLYKGESGFCECGEAFGEYYMHQVAEIMGFEYVFYDLAECESRIYSTCELFTNENEGYAPINFFLSKEQRKLKKMDFAKMIEPYFDKQKFEDLMLFDALIYNTDRHLGNFGLIFDTQTGEILRPAPIFDNGCSLFSLLQKDDLKDIFGTLCVHKSYFDLAFIDQIVLFVRKRHIKNLQKLLNFSFKRHKKFNLNDEWLVAAEQFIRNNAKYALHFAGYDRSELIKVDERSLHPLILKDIAALTKAHELKNECDIEKWQYALQSTLNVFQYSKRISGEVADFLRAKYLGLYYNGIEAQNIVYAFENLDKNS